MNKQLAKDTRRAGEYLDDENWLALGGFNSKATMGREVLDFFVSQIPKGSTVLELGSGQSTRELVNHYTVYTVEHNESYLNLVPGAHYIHAPLWTWQDGDLNKTVQWYDLEVMSTQLPERYDALIIDGPEGKLARYGAARHAELFRKDVPILIDDMQQPFVYMTALILARKRGSHHIDVRITRDQRVYGYITPN